MALVRISQSPFTIQAGTGTNTYVLGDVSDGVVGTVTLILDTTSAGTVSCVVQARPRGIALSSTAPPFLPIPYLSLTDGGSVVAGATYSTAALTGDGDQILIPASGFDIALDVTFTSGVHVVYFTLNYGAAA